MLWEIIATFGMLSFVVGYGFQINEICRRNSSNAISVSWIIGTMAASLAAMSYGLSEGEYTLWENGVVSLICQVVLLYTVWGHKTVSTRDIGFASVLIPMVISISFIPKGCWLVPYVGITAGYHDAMILAVGFTAWLAQFFELKGADQNSAFLEGMPKSQILGSVALGWFCWHTRHLGPFVGFAFHSAGQAWLIYQNRAAKSRPAAP